VPTVPFSTEEVATKGKAIYAASIRPTLTDADKGKLVTIHTETGEYLIVADDETHAAEVATRFGAGQPLYTLRVGYRAVYSFRPGLNRELVEW
jgi:hypothetical protein